MLHPQTKNAESPAASPELRKATKPAPTPGQQLQRSVGNQAVLRALQEAPDELPGELRASMERAFEADFSEVKVHVEGRAESVGADAFTAGNDIHFAPGRFVPSTSAGRTLIAHELTHVLQQRSGRVDATRETHGVAVNDAPALEAEADRLGAQAADGVRVAHDGHRPSSGARAALAVRQFSNPADTRLPATQVEALSHAATANTEITAAIARLAASALENERNVSDYIAGQGLTVRPMTPRHDSAVGAPNINFFPGFLNYSGSFTLPATVTHRVSGTGLTKIDVRARDHANVDTMLPAAEVQRRVMQAVGEAAETRAGSHPTISTWDVYQARFNGWWNVAPYAGQGTQFDLTITTSRGPRSPRARNIFDRIYAEDSVFAAAYDANTGGIRERVDSYMGPEARNPFSSPRLQALRAAFFTYPVPIVTAPRYALFLADIQSVSATLSIADREVVSRSNEWHALIASHLDTEARRIEIRNTITTVPPALGGGGAVAPVVPPPAGGGGLTPQQFLDSAFIDGPMAPTSATQRTEPVTLTPQSANANPGVAVDTRLTVTPAARVRGTNVSPTTPWPNASTTGSPFTVDIHNTGTVTMTAQLDLLNAPGGLTPATPPTLQFDIVDDRTTFFVANWRPTVSFARPGSRKFFAPGDTVRYMAGGQAFETYAQLPAGSVNPGLPFSARARVLRAGVQIVAPQTIVFPADQRRTLPLLTPVSAPGGAPAPDPLVFEVELLDATGAVLSTRSLAITVLPEVTFTQLQAETEAIADRAFLRGNGPGQLLTLMTAAGGMSARFAAAVNNGTIVIDAATLRHDSAAYVALELGGPDPGQKAVFEGISYGPHPDPNTRVKRAGVKAYSLPNRVWVIRTTDVAAPTKRTDPDVMDTALHEGVHALDPRNVPYAFTTIERYRREFRAYWMDGGFGPPDQPLCLGAAGCFDAVYDATMPPPGPKSPRARQIFSQLYRTYAYVKPAYDANTDGFREFADSYYHPDGINLMLSQRLDELARHITAGITGTFPAFQQVVQSYMGIVGPPPASGVLDADERAYIRRNRAWRDLVEAKVTVPAERAAIKTDLNIP